MGQDTTRHSPLPTRRNALLSLKVCDPACGSGHFLIAAANRLSHHLATARTGDEEPSPAARRVAFRDVVSHCIYGVDINPMAVELCKVALWLESIDPGKPLSFLDHRILCGNSLIGVTPRLLAEGIPDDAFKPIEGDDKAVVSEYKRRNKDEKKGQLQLDFGAMPSVKLDNLAQTFANLAAMDDGSLQDVEAKEKKYAEFVESTGYQSARLLADAWCAAFVWKKDRSTDDCITESWFRRIEANPHCLPPWMREEIDRLRDQYQFFHWHLAFPDAFRVPGDDESPENEQTGWSGGFDCVLGNPPWEKLTILETEFFAGKDTRIASTKTKAQRTKMLLQLAVTDPQLNDVWVAARRQSDGSVKLIQDGGRFPFSSKGELNTYLPFTELGLQVAALNGAFGMVVKSSIFTSDTATPLLSHLTRQGFLISLFDFRNWEGLFPAVGYHERFTLLSYSRQPNTATVPCYAFYCDRAEDVNDPERLYTLDREVISRLSPNSGKVPILSSRRDSTILQHIASRFPVLVDDVRKSNPWYLEYGSLFHMSAASGYFLTKEELFNEGYEYVGGKMLATRGAPSVAPFYEGKFIQAYDHRFSSFEGVSPKLRFGRKPGTHNPTRAQKEDPHYAIEPRYWIPSSVAKLRIDEKMNGATYFCAARRVTNVISNARTSMACIMPAYPANDMIVSLSLLTDGECRDHAIRVALFTSVLNSVVFDFGARLRVSENLLKGALFELFAPTPTDLNDSRWTDGSTTAFVDHVVRRVTELTYTTMDLEPFATDCGYDGPPFRWDEGRRFLIRCELDAAYFHLYGIERDDVDYIMETFPIVKRKDIKAHGHYRTKDTILEIYDEMAEAMKTGKPYQTRLDPPPGPPADAEGNFLPLPQWLPGQPRPADWPSHIHPPDDVAVGDKETVR